MGITHVHTCVQSINECHCPLNILQPLATYSNNCNNLIIIQWNYILI